MDMVKKKNFQDPVAKMRGAPDARGNGPRVI